MATKFVALRPIWRPFIICAATLAVLFWRRPDQFLSPTLWTEDLTFNLRDYQAHGLLSIFDPAAGYYYLAGKIVLLPAFKLSIGYAPEIAAALTALFTCAVICAIAFSPTHLKWPVLCAAVVLLIPTDPEVFMIGLYAVWWAGLLLLLALVWDGDRRPMLRYGLILFGGFSSPVILVVAPLLVVRAWFERSRHAVIAAGVAVVPAALDALSLLTSNGMRRGEITLDAVIAGGEKLGVPVLLAALCVPLVMPKRPHPSYYLLGVAALMLCALTLVRETGAGIHFIFGGPRYFFYPYVAIMWMLIWVAAMSPRPVRALVLGSIGAVVIGVAAYDTHTPYYGFSRRHAPVDWRGRLSRCELVAQYDGDPSRLTPFKADCDALRRQSLF